MNCLIKDQIRFRVGKKVRGKQTDKNVYMFVEYETEKDMQVNPVARLLKKRKLTYSKVSYKAGTNTYRQIRKSSRLDLEKKPKKK